MPKLEKRLVEARDAAVLFLWKKKYTAQEIAIIFDVTTSMVYNIIKESKVEQIN